MTRTARSSLKGAAEVRPVGAAPMVSPRDLSGRPAAVGPGGHDKRTDPLNNHTRRESGMKRLPIVSVALVALVGSAVGLNADERETVTGTASGTMGTGNGADGIIFDSIAPDVGPRPGPRGPRGLPRGGARRPRALDQALGGRARGPERSRRPPMTVSATSTGT